MNDKPEPWAKVLKDFLTVPPPPERKPTSEKPPAK